METWESIRHEGQRKRSKRRERLIASFSKRLAEATTPLTQVEFAAELGLVSSQINHWKNGKTLPSIEDLVGIAVSTHIPIEELLELRKTEPDYPQGASGGDIPKNNPIDLLTPLLNYLVSEDETEKIERNADVIWDATPDFLYAHDIVKWGDIIFENITERNTEYYFLYKDTPDNRIKEAHLISRLQSEIPENWRMLAHFAPVNANTFPGWSENILYDPYGKNPRCLMALPYAYGTKGTGFNLELARPMRDAFRDWFKAIWNDNVKDENSRIVGTSIE